MRPGAARSRRSCCSRGPESRCSAPSAATAGRGRRPRRRVRIFARRREEVGSGRQVGPGVWTPAFAGGHAPRSEEHTSELQSLMRISYDVFCLKKKRILKLPSRACETNTKHNRKTIVKTIQKL